MSEFKREIKDIEKLKAELENLKLQAAQKDQHIADLQIQLNDLNTNYQSALADADNHRNMLAQAQTDIEQLNQTNQALNDQIQELIANNINNDAQLSKEADITRNKQLQDVIARLSALIVEV